jgi:alkylation response protein AidB-like acyl-CoA dehydrogenase
VEFSWTKEQLALRRSVIQFARAELTHDQYEHDAREEFSWDAWKKCAQFGIHGLPIPQEYGGRGDDILTTACALEALGYASRDNGLIFSINAHMWSAEIPFLMFGNEAQKLRYLPKLVSGEFVGIHAMTEPGAGSDAFGSLRSRAERKGDRYVINGSKTFITNAPIADVVIVFANLEPEKGPRGISGFIVDKGTPGFNISRKLHKSGLRTSPMAELAFVDCEVPVENLLGKEGAGVAIFTASMEWERICILASQLGTMQRLIESCVRHTLERKKANKEYASFSARIAEMEIRLETSRLVLYQAAWLKSQGKHPLREAAICKAYVAEACVQTCLDAVQIFGPAIVDCQIERELRDALSGRIYSGTSEVQKSIISGLHGL